MVDVACLRRTPAEKAKTWEQNGALVHLSLGEGVPKQHGPSHRVMQQSHSMHVRQGSGNVRLARPLSLRLECGAGSTSDLRNAGTPRNCGVLKHPCPIPALGVIHNRVTQMFSQSWGDSAGD